MEARDTRTLNPESAGSGLRAALRSWALLTGLGLVLVGAPWLFTFGLDPRYSPWALASSPGAADALLGLGEVVVALLGIAITVVAILVELAASRVTPRIAEHFVRDPVNQVALSGFVLTSLLVIWSDLALGASPYPGGLALAAAGASTAALLGILPYFAYVFDFLTPTRVVQRIRDNALGALRRVARKGERSLGEGRATLLHSVDQLGDIALSALEKKDKALTLTTLEALAEVATGHLLVKGHLPKGWFESDALARGDHDFAALHPDMVRALTSRRTWVEMKVLRQYQGLYDAALHQLRDVNHLIAIHTRRVARQALERNDEPAVQLCLRFLNTYLRSAINGRDLRTAYNVANEVRLLARAAMILQRDELVLEIANKMAFYGQLGFSQQLPFILETFAYDLCSLLEAASERRAACHDALLDLFLEVDREPDGGKAQEAGLRGVRKAQIKLATHYLVAGRTDLARRIFDDLAHEPRQRLISIRAELESVREAEYWEVVDRGIHFDWLPPNQRARLAEFFAWFDEEAGQ